VDCWCSGRSPAVYARGLHSRPRARFASVAEAIDKANGKLGCDLVIDWKQSPNVSAGTFAQHRGTPTIDKVTSTSCLPYIASVEEEEGMARWVIFRHAAPAGRVQFTIFQQDFVVAAGRVQLPVSCEMHDPLWRVVKQFSQGIHISVDRAVALQLSKRLGLCCLGVQCARSCVVGAITNIFCIVSVKGGRSLSPSVMCQRATE